MRWYDGCPFCPHPMMNHDGDGASEHYSCCNDECACRWEWSPCDAETDYEPVSLVGWDAARAAPRKSARGGAMSNTPRKHVTEMFGQQPTGDD